MSDKLQSTRWPNGQNSATFWQTSLEIWRMIFSFEQFLKTIRFSLYNTASQKNCHTLSLSISSPNINQFSKFFHWRTLWTTCNEIRAVKAL